MCHLEYQDVPFAGTPGQPFYLPLTVQRLYTQSAVPPYQAPYCTCANTSWDIQRDNYLLSVLPHPDSAAPPTAAFTAKLSGDAAHQWNFDASGSHADSGIASYHWTFGDGATATTSTPTTTHTYRDGSDHTASLVVVDSGGTASPAASQDTYRERTGREFHRRLTGRQTRGRLRHRGDRRVAAGAGMHVAGSDPGGRRGRAATRSRSPCPGRRRR